MATGTHTSSSPEGDTTFDEEHPQVASSNHKQDTAEAKVDEADQDLHSLWEAEKAQATDLGPRALHRPLPSCRPGFPQLLGKDQEAKARLLIRIDPALLRLGGAPGHSLSRGLSSTALSSFSDFLSLGTLTLSTLVPNA